MKALVVGGTGPTGPHVVAGLRQRGYEVTIFHRGVHEPPELADVEHIHGDPHFKESIAEALGTRRFDLVLAMYGRVRYLAEVMAGRCERFISIGGMLGLRGQDVPEARRPFGFKVLLREDDPIASEEESRIGHLIGMTERKVFELHDQGAFSATHIRYAEIYGPRSLTPKEWQVVRRLADGRAYMTIPDAGLLVTSRVAPANAAHAVMLAVEQPHQAARQIYHCADDEPYSVRQWYEMIIDAAGGGLDLVSLPEQLAAPFHVLLKAHHHMVADTSKIRRELGYSDVVSCADALKESVEWYRRHPVTRNSHPNYRDPFDYAAEDKTVNAYRSLLSAISSDLPQIEPMRHGYAHPKTPGLADHRLR